jgi:hypothetical protein
MTVRTPLAVVVAGGLAVPAMAAEIRPDPNKTGGRYRSPAPFGFSHCQKLIGPPSSSVWNTCLLGGEHAPVLTQPWPRMGQTERPQGIADDPQNATHGRL